MFECPNAPCFIPGPLGDVAINSLSVTAPCCQYSATCTNPLSTMQFNNNADRAQTGPGFPGPETLPSGTVDAMCRRGAPKYVHNSPMFGPSTTIGRIRCP
uniref:Uncharacterized protein n=1 Tax=Panagrolaimus sp. PS1159 TaxID=55785 RepID=A0AC35GSK5_9BILA